MPKTPEERRFWSWGTRRITRLKSDAEEIRTLLDEVKAHITAGTEDAQAQTKLDSAIAKIDSMKDR